MTILNFEFKTKGLRSYGLGWGLGSWKQAGKNSLRGRYGRPRQRPGDTSRFVFISFLEQASAQIIFTVLCLL